MVLENKALKQVRHDEKDAVRLVGILHATLFQEVTPA
jgi:hypothetical protein